jgi:hypothetical protein
MLANILSCSILNRKVQVFEVFITRCMSSASNIKNVCNTRIDEFFSFKTCIKRSHVNSFVHFNQVKLFEVVCHIGVTLLKVGEARTNETFFFVVITISILLTGLIHSLCIDGKTTWLVFDRTI